MGPVEEEEVATVVVTAAMVAVTAAMVAVTAVMEEEAITAAAMVAVTAVMEEEAITAAAMVVITLDLIVRILINLLAQKVGKIEVMEILLKTLNMKMVEAGEKGECLMRVMLQTRQISNPFLQAL